MRFIRYLDLKQLCLNVIIEHLEKYILSKNVPQKHIDFLHRVYSEEVFNKFRHKQYLTEEYILWFLNPYSKKVTLPMVSENIVKRLQEMGTTVTSLSLSSCSATPEMILSVLCCVRHVKELDLSSSTCNNWTLLCIPKMCPQVISLNLRSCSNVTDEGMDNLCCKNLLLQYLNLRGTQVKHIGIAIILKRMPSLEVLKYKDLPNTIYDIWKCEVKNGRFENCQVNLKDFFYENETSNLNQVFRCWTTLFPTTSKLVFDFSVTYSDLLLCSSFKNLEHVKLNSKDSLLFQDNETQRLYSGHTFNVLVHFLPSARSLTTLTLVATEVSLKMLIECFKSLRILCLEDVSFTDIIEDATVDNALDEIAFKFTFNSFEDNINTQKAISILFSTCKNVSRLCICVGSIPEDILNIILDTMHNLSVIDFGYTTIEQPIIEKFFKLPSLTTVRFPYNFVIENYPCLEGKVSQKIMSWFELDDNEFDDDSDNISETSSVENETNDYYDYDEDHDINRNPFCFY